MLSPSASCCFGHSKVPAGCPFVLPLLQSRAAGPAALVFLLITVKLGIIIIKAKMRCLCYQQTQPRGCLRTPCYIHKTLEPAPGWQQPLGDTTSPAFTGGCQGAAGWGRAAEALGGDSPAGGFAAGGPLWQGQLARAGSWQHHAAADPT